MIEKKFELMLKKLFNYTQHRLQLYKYTNKMIVRSLIEMHP